MVGSGSYIVRLSVRDLHGPTEMILFEVERYYLVEKQQPFLEQLYKTIFCLGYYGMLRVGELFLSPHVIKACDIHMGNNKDKIMIVLYSSKTHGRESKLQKIRISALPKHNSVLKHTRFFCPFKVMTRFMNVRYHYRSHSEQLFIFSDGSPVKPSHIRTVLRVLLARLGLDSKLYDVHSLKIGRTCDLERFGYSLDQIKAMGWWKSKLFTDISKT